MTQSNGKIDQVNSLHSLKSTNQYKTAIKEVCEILLHYDEDNSVPLFGFGGKPQFEKLKSETTLHCFPVSNCSC